MFVLNLFAAAAMAATPEKAKTIDSLFGPDNLVAWCIVPFDAMHRGPAERAEMVRRLGLKRVAYDWRDPDVPTFEDEIVQYKKHGIEFTAFWGWHPEFAKLVEKHGITPQFWEMIPDPGGNLPQDQRVAEAGKRLLEAAKRARELGCKLALYNHGGWAGEPQNMVAVCRWLRDNADADHVGIVYNLHHGHEHISDFADVLALMKPYLFCLNLNGMNDGARPKIVPLAQGQHDETLLRIIVESGYRGPIGILDHEGSVDSELRLRDNLAGLAWLVRKLKGQDPGPPPEPASYRAPGAPESQKPPAPAFGPSVNPAFGRSLASGGALEADLTLGTPPITVECWAKLSGKSKFNILVASEPKSSKTHWELYTYAQDGDLSVYMPGRGGEYRSGVDICDNEWHHVTMVFEAERLLMYVDGRLVKDAQLPALPGKPADKGVAVGRLVEGGIGCEGRIDNVRVSTVARPINGVPDRPLVKDEHTALLLNFEDVPATKEGPRAESEPPDAWAVENPEQRAALPLYKTIPAASSDELTPTNGWPDREVLARWHRSHGNAGATRFSSLDQINRDNVKRLAVAWIYRSGDGKGNIQSNPVIAGGLMFVPTVGHHVVAVDAVTGEERWRFKPGARPAHRGMVYVPARDGRSPRLMFTAGPNLFALDPATGEPPSSFGKDGRVPMPDQSTAGPVVHDRTIVVAGFSRDVFGFDIETGEQRWTFHTIPRPGEFGHDTWDRTESGANCWGGMSLDPQRGIVYLTTGSPKPNFDGTGHRGDNLFGNCLVALDANTGKRLWHFQEIRHDIWDLDTPAPPNLVTIERDGRRIDAVAAVTKIGNTLLLDRVTGKPIFPFRLRRAPASTVPGEQTAAYQPDVELPQPFARQEFTVDDVTDRTPEAQQSVLNRVTQSKIGWFQPPVVGRPIVFYGIHGGAEWTGASVSPDGRLYVSSNELPWIITLLPKSQKQRDPDAPPTPGQQVYMKTCVACHGPNKEGVGVGPPLHALDYRMDDKQVIDLLKTGRNLMPPAPPMTDQEQADLLDFLFDRDLPEDPDAAPRPHPQRPDYTFAGFDKLLDPDGYPGCKPPWGTLNCLDLNSGKLLWKVPLGEYEELTRQGIPTTGTENFGGPTATAGGLVFVAGTRDSKIRAFDAETGEELWSARLPFIGSAPPAVYEAGGRQYVVVPATGGGKLGGPMGDAFVAFALPEDE